LNNRKKQNINSNIVYNIPCNDCNFVYVGQTKRDLKSRISEHKSALHLNYVNSNVAEHSFKFKHDVNFNGAIVKYKESNRNSRLFLEKFDIEHKKFNKIPLMNDQLNCANNFPSIYKCLFVK
jgi:predicted GIY-YIG superfamily endonuclease